MAGPRRGLSGAALVVAGALGCSSCVSFQFSRTTHDRAVEDEELASFEVGRTAIGDVLGRLGAPLYVWEYKGDGAALAYGFLRDDGRGARLSIPVTNDFSASMDYEEVDARMRGVVLLFGADEKLEQWRRGFLRDIRAQTGVRRPAPPPEDGS